jgi:translocator protein
MKLNLKLLVLCILITFSIGFIGSIFTSGNTNSEWYQSIKPSITPPNIVFPIVWNILFLLISFSLYLALTDSKNKKERDKLILAFGLNFILNILWSFLFFELKFVKLAFFELILFWFSILFLLVLTNKINKTSSYLLFPYFFWVAFAGILNFLIAF